MLNCLVADMLESATEVGWMELSFILAELLFAALLFNSSIGDSTLRSILDWVGIGVDKLVSTKGTDEVLFKKGVNGWK